MTETGENYTPEEQKKMIDESRKRRGKKTIAQEKLEETTDTLNKRVSEQRENQNKK